MHTVGSACPDQFIQIRQSSTGVPTEQYNVENLSLRSSSQVISDYV